MLFSERINRKIFQESLPLNLRGRFPSLKSFHPFTRDSIKPHWPIDAKLDQTTIKNQKIRKYKIGTLIIGKYKIFETWQSGPSLDICPYNIIFEINPRNNIDNKRFQETISKWICLTKPVFFLCLVLHYRSPEWVPFVAGNLTFSSDKSIAMIFCILHSWSYFWLKNCPPRFRKGSFLGCWCWLREKLSRSLVIQAEFSGLGIFSRIWYFVWK